VIVEIFPQKKEFAVRTFGLHGATGLLGVCFGSVITANSPASQGEDPSNWEAVLWHEFCHVVTLSKTRNKMPRWLSEGISVYEEEQENPTWGDALNPRFRALILGDKLTPLSAQLRVLAPKSGLHLSSPTRNRPAAVPGRAIRLPALKGCSTTWARGDDQREAARRTKMTLVQLDQDFAKFARGRPRASLPRATLGRRDRSWRHRADRGSWLEKHPKSFWGLRRLGPGSWPRRNEDARQTLGRSRDSIRNTSDRRTPTCCSPPSTAAWDPGANAPGPRGPGDA
jgi:hypothetical protein